MMAVMWWAMQLVLGSAVGLTLAAVGGADGAGVGHALSVDDGSSVGANLDRRGSWQALGSLAAIGLAPLLVFGWARLLMSTFRDAVSISQVPFLY